MHLTCELPISRGKCKVEEQGGVTKARLALASNSSYLVGSDYDQLIKDTHTLKKFEKNRRFVEQLLDTSKSYFICISELPISNDLLQ